MQVRHERHGYDPGLGKVPWYRAWQPTPVFLPGEFHGQRSLAGCSPWGRTESDMTEATQHLRMLPALVWVLFSCSRVGRRVVHQPRILWGPFSAQCTLHCSLLSLISETCSLTTPSPASHPVSPAPENSAVLPLHNPSSHTAVPLHISFPARLSPAPPGWLPEDTHRELNKYPMWDSLLWSNCGLLKTEAEI